jgi:aspartyl-tRNA(Asn)/glutamyl-tRNA(Gln) amidotransferase subunit C
MLLKPGQLNMNKDDVEKAGFYKIDLLSSRALAQLNDIFGMIERMRAVDTEGVVPMSHPLGGAQRLRADAVTDVPDRERNLANAPARQDGLFLVPRVLE